MQRGQRICIHSDPRGRSESQQMDIHSWMGNVSGDEQQTVFSYTAGINSSPPPRMIVDLVCQASRCGFEECVT